MIVRRCPWCVEFSVPEGETTFSTEIGWGPDTVVLRASRPAWEIYMAEHWRDAHPDQYAAWAGPLLAEVGDDVKAALTSVVRSLGVTSHPPLEV